MSVRIMDVIRVLQNNVDVMQKVIKMLGGVRVKKAAKTGNHQSQEKALGSAHGVRTECKTSIRNRRSVRTVTAAVNRSIQRFALAVALSN